MSGVSTFHKTGNRPIPSSGHHRKMGCSFCSSKFFIRSDDSQQDSETRTQLLQCLAAQIPATYRRVPRECTRSSFPLCRDCLGLLESLRKNDVEHRFKERETLLEAIKMKVLKGVRMDSLAHKKAKKLAPPSITPMIFQIRKMILAGSRFGTVTVQLMLPKAGRQPTQKEKVRGTHQGKEAPQVFYSSGSSTPWKVECNWASPGIAASVKDDKNVEDVGTEARKENQKNYVLPAKMGYLKNLRTKPNIKQEQPYEELDDDDDISQVQQKKKKKKEMDESSTYKTSADFQDIHIRAISEKCPVTKTKRDVPDLLRITEFMQPKLRRSTRILDAACTGNGKHST